MRNTKDFTYNIFQNSKIKRLLSHGYIIRDSYKDVLTTFSILTLLDTELLPTFLCNYSLVFVSCNDAAS